MRSRLIAVSLLAVLVVVVARAGQLAVVGSTGVDVIDTASGKTLASASIPGGATQLLATRDGARLVAISRGPGATSWLGHFKPKGKASVVVIDGQSMKVLHQTELGWDASDAQITPDEKSAVILSPGADGKPASAYSIDLATGALAGKVDFDRGASGSALVGGDHVVVYFEGASPQKTLLRFLTVPALSADGDVSIDAKTTAPAAFENHDLIYLLDAARFHATNLYVVSASQRKLVMTHKIGEIASIGAFDPDTSRLFVLNQSTERGKRAFNGRIDVFKNGQPEQSMKTIDIPAKMTISPDRRLALVYSQGKMVTLDLSTLEQGKPTLSTVPHSTYFTPDQKRMLLYYASEEACCGVAVFDVEGRTVLKRFGVGGRGVRIAQALLALTATASSFSSGYAAAKRTGASSFYYSVYTPRAAAAGRGTLVINPDGKFAYAVDPQSDRVTFIDIAAADRLKTDVKTDAGANELVALHNGGVLAVLGQKGLTFVDTAARTVLREERFTGELRTVEVTPDGSRAIAIADGRIAIFDDQGKLLAENTSVAQPHDWILLK